MGALKRCQIKWSLEGNLLDQTSKGCLFFIPTLVFKMKGLPSILKFLESFRAWAFKLLFDLTGERRTYLINLRKFVLSLIKREFIFQGVSKFLKKWSQKFENPLKTLRDDPSNQIAKFQFQPNGRCNKYTIAIIDYCTSAWTSFAVKYKWFIPWIVHSWTGSFWILLCTRLIYK